MTCIVIFAKAPIAGRVKTRLIPSLGADGAAALAARMLQSTVEAAIATDLKVELWGDPDPKEWYHGPRLTLRSQSAGNLGERLAIAARRSLGAGESVLLIGTDCPELTAERLRKAAAALDRHHAVIHPVRDGGYALLGLGRFDPSIFEGIAWSTPSVAETTIARIGALGWSLAVGETLSDIDEPEDLERAALS
jgi:rSAM/selenodomain-associated transferase 1